MSREKQDLQGGENSKEIFKNHKLGEMINLTFIFILLKPIDFPLGFDVVI